MSRYIEFTRSPKNRLTKFSQDNPVHTGNIPTPWLSLKGVRVDGEPISFIDESIPEKLHRAIVGGRSIARKGNVFDCVVFAALLSAVELCPTDSSGTYGFNHVINETEVDPEDHTISTPLNLGLYREGFVYYKHTVAPAHKFDRPYYLHKLGRNGPICMSELTPAMRMYGCVFAHPVVSTEVSRTTGLTYKVLSDN